MGGLPEEVVAGLDNAATADDYKTLRAWVLKAPYLTSATAAKKLFVYAAPLNADEGGNDPLTRKLE